METAENMELRDIPGDFVNENYYYHHHHHRHHHLYCIYVSAGFGISPSVLSLRFNKLHRI
jgi:hypothetical protein